MFQKFVILSTVFFFSALVVAQENISTNRNPSSLEYNILFKADAKYTVTTNWGYSGAAFFDGKLSAYYPLAAPTESNPLVITIEDLPNIHTQVSGFIGWTTRYWQATKFKIEGYNTHSSSALGWKTIADYSTTSYTGGAAFMQAINPKGSYTKIRFTFYEAAGSNGRLGLSELIFIHPEATTPYKAFIDEASPWEENGQGVVYDGDIYSASGSGGKLTLFDENPDRRNRFIAGADDQGAYIKSTWGNGGTDAFSIRDSSDNHSFHIDSGSKVGIGTTTPTAKFSVEHSGTIGGSGDLTQATIHVKNGGMELGIDANQIYATNGLYFHSGVGHHFTTGSNHEERIRIESNGNVGIGTTSPSETLTVSRSGATIGLYDTNPASNANNRMARYNNGLVFQNDLSGSWNDNIFLSDTGTVGIGTTAAYNGILTVNGDSYNTMRLENDVAGKEASIRFRAKSTSGGTLHSDIALYATGSNQGYLGFKVPHNNTANQGYDMIINHAGDVGIGTMTTGSHKLAVEGSIGAREIKVEASGWSDFVFEDDYNLPTLQEVEQHIEEKGHLQDIPSAAEVAENGIFLGEMDSKLLQKIEELMLYTIQQEKKIENLTLEIIKLKKQINE